MSPPRLSQPQLPTTVTLSNIPGKWRVLFPQLLSLPEVSNPPSSLLICVYMYCNMLNSVFMSINQQINIFIHEYILNKAVLRQLTLGQLPLGQLPWGQLPQGQLPRRTITPIGQLPLCQLPPGQLPLGTSTPRDIYPFRTTTPIGRTITPEDNYPHLRNIIIFS